MKKAISLALIINLIVSIVFLVFEPQNIKAAVDTDVITVSQAVSPEISITSPSDVAMSSSIPGMTGNPGSPTTGDATWTVKSNDSSGFNMTISASSDPAMRLDGTWNFGNYSPAGAGTPDYNWATPAASAAEFGFTVEPATDGDTVQLFLDDGGAPCNDGSTQTADKCWYNLATTDLTIINRTSETSSSGEAEKVKFQVESNAKFLKEGTYQATITVTATTN